MELFRSVLGGKSAISEANPAASAAETIERLVDRLTSSTLLDDRRDSCRALKAMSKKFRVEVGVQALDAMTAVLETDRNDEEILGYALDTLCNICSPEEFDEEIASERAKDSITGIGEQFTEIYLKKSSNVQLVLDSLQEFDFRIRRPAVKLLTHLLLNKPREMQEIILSSQLGVSRLMDVLVDTREVLRNDSLLLLIQLTKGNANLQKIVAFENCFDKLADILEVEGYSDGGIVVEDCLRLMLNLLRNNASNQTFFREGSYIQRIAPFFDLTLEEEEIEVGWSAQKVSNMLHMLNVIRTLVSPSNPTHVTASCQKTILSCGLLEKLSAMLLAAGIPADILTETINTISEAIRGYLPSQEFFAKVQAPSSPQRPALILLLMSMVNEKQPFSLRCSVLYCFQSYLHKNPAAQSSVMSSLLPSEQDASPSANAVGSEISPGQLLCGGLFSYDKLSNWLASVALAHGLGDQEDLKVEMLTVKLSTASENAPLPLLDQCCHILLNASHVQTRLGLLMLISIWVNKCPKVVASLLSVNAIVPFLTGQIGSNEHDETERVAQGLCAFVLGLCLIDNDDSNPDHTQEKLYQIIEKRIGFETFMTKLSEVSKHEGYNRALKHPQLKCHEVSELVFDHKFAQEFKHLEHSIISFLNRRRENNEKMANEDASQVDPLIVQQYKDVIRDQDLKIQERDRDITHLREENSRIAQELSSAKQQIDEFKSNIETLKDMNSVLQAQSGSHSFPADSFENATIPNGPNSNSFFQVDVNEKSSPSRGADVTLSVAKLEREIKIRDDIIHELEMRLAAGEGGEPGYEDGQTRSAAKEEGASRAELDMLNSQVETLQITLSQRDAHIDNLESILKSKSNEDHDALQSELELTRNELTSVKNEQKDLLLLLADQAAKLEQYEEFFRQQQQQQQQLQYMPTMNNNSHT